MQRFLEADRALTEARFRNTEGAIFFVGFSPHAKLTVRIVRESNSAGDSAAGADLLKLYRAQASQNSCVMLDHLLARVKIAASGAVIGFVWRLLLLCRCA